MGKYEDRGRAVSVAAGMKIGDVVVDLVTIEAR
jgi:hypothetical protein